MVLLNESIVEMMDMVSRQLERARLAVMEHRYDLAQEVLALEKKVNGMELKIDKDCENILALYNPVAIDLRFVMASMKINSNLERIGDNAESIAHYISHGNPKIPADFLNAFRIDEMFLMVISMINDVKKGFVEEDTHLARQVFSKDFHLNEANHEATQTAIQLGTKDPGDMPVIIPLLSSVRKLERSGDLIKNIAEEIIFYLEAKVLKHHAKLEK